MCIRLNLQPLAMTVKEHALLWVQSLGKLLRESAKDNLFSLRDLLVRMLLKSLHVRNAVFIRCYLETALGSLKDC